MPDYMKLLAQPIKAKTGLSDIERRGIYNLGRRQIQGATKTAMEQMRTQLGGRGFRAGESGIADTALGQIASQGAERLGAFATQTALEERKRRFEEAAQLGGLNVQRMAAGAGLQGQLAQAGATRSAAGMALEGRMAELEFAKERFGQEFAYTKEQQSLQNMMDMWRMQQGAQGTAWDRYAASTYNR